MKKLFFIFLLCLTSVTALNVSFEPVFNVSLDNGSVLVERNGVVLFNGSGNVSGNFSIEEVVFVDPVVVNVTKVESVNLLNQTLNVTVANCSVTEQDVELVVNSKLGEIRDKVDLASKNCVEELFSMKEQLGVCNERMTSLELSLKDSESALKINQTAKDGDERVLRTEKAQCDRERASIERDIQTLSIINLLLLAGLLFLVIQMSGGLRFGGMPKV